MTNNNVAINLGTILNAHLMTIEANGMVKVNQELQRIGKVTNEARRAKLAPPISWELLCDIVPESFKGASPLGITFCCFECLGHDIYDPKQKC
jgi:hypothetical protein